MFPCSSNLASEPNLKMKSSVKQNLFNRKHFSPLSKRKELKPPPFKHQVPGINIGKPPSTIEKNWYAEN